MVKQKFDDLFVALEGGRLERRAVASALCSDVGALAE
jgi:hypothetical protein